MSVPFHGAEIIVALMGLVVIAVVALQSQRGSRGRITAALVAATLATSCMVHAVIRVAIASEPAWGRLENTGAEAGGPGLTVAVFITAWAGLTAPADAPLHHLLRSLCAAQRDLQWRVNATIITASPPPTPFPHLVECHRVQLVLRGANRSRGVQRLHSQLSVASHIVARSIGMYMEMEARPLLLQAARSADLYMVCEDDLIVRPSTLTAFVQHANRMRFPLIPVFKRYEHTGASGFTRPKLDGAVERQDDRVTIDGDQIVCDLPLDGLQDGRDGGLTVSRKAVAGGSEEWMLLGAPWRMHAGMYVLTQRHLLWLTEERPHFFRRGGFQGDAYFSKESSMLLEVAMSEVYWSAGLTPALPAFEIEAFLVQHARNNLHLHGAHGIGCFPLAVVRRQVNKAVDAALRSHTGTAPLLRGGEPQVGCCGSNGTHELRKVRAAASSARPRGRSRWPSGERERRSRPERDRRPVGSASALRRATAADLSGARGSIEPLDHA